MNSPSDSDDLHPEKLPVYSVMHEVKNLLLHLMVVGLSLVWLIPFTGFIEYDEFSDIIIHFNISLTGTILLVLILMQYLFFLFLRMQLFIDNNILILKTGTKLRFMDLSTVTEIKLRPSKRIPIFLILINRERKVTVPLFYSGLSAVLKKIHFYHPEISETESAAAICNRRDLAFQWSSRPIRYIYALSIGSLLVSFITAKIIWQISSPLSLIFAFITLFYPVLLYLITLLNNFLLKFLYPDLNDEDFIQRSEKNFTSALLFGMILYLMAGINFRNICITLGQ